MQAGIKSYLITFFVFLSFLFVLFGYLPVVINNSGLYDFFRTVNYVLFSFLLILLAKFGQIFHSRVLFTYFMVLFIFLLETLIFISFDLITGAEDLLEISIPFAAILIGYNINFSVPWYHKLLRIYCISALVLGLYSVVYYIGSFTILDRYLVEHKNSLGAILSNSAAILLCMVFVKDIGKFRKIRLISYCVLFFVCILVLRARSAFVALFVFIVIITWVTLKMRYKYVIAWILCVGVIIMFLLPELTFPTFLQNFFFGGKDITDLNMISSGRIERNIVALEQIADYPLFGQLSSQASLEMVHNYFLLKVSQYGIVGSFPLIFLYMFLFWTVIVRILNIREVKTENFGYLVMIVPFTISLLEPSFPYGPGSVQVLIYFMFGYSLQHSET